MSVRDLLAELRAGRRPAPDAVAAFARGLADGSVSDAQAGAFAMAVCRGPGLGNAGRVALTRAMAEGGARLSWDLDGPVLDKHSTGGIGDPVSLVLAPLLAAAGAYVPMISGRGLGHTGGTLDKLEAIPGVSVELEAGAFRAVVAETGCAIVAAGAGIAPADRRLYAIRDVTATVDQIDLITASILSKKLAAGLDALVLDVKCGTGAFMRDPAAAGDLARALVETAEGAGCPAAALVTAMDAPLAPACGNALEIAAVLEVLTERPDAPLARVALALGEALLARAGMSADLEALLRSGQGAERFARMVAAQGGPSDLLARWRDLLPAAPVVRPVPAPEAGLVASMDGAALGRAVVSLGGGRQREGAAIDPAVGLSGVAALGAAVAAGDPLALVHAADEDTAARAVAQVQGAIHLAETAPPAPLILERLP